MRMRNVIGKTKEKRPLSFTKRQEIYLINIRRKRLANMANAYRLKREAEKAI